MYDKELIYDVGANDGSDTAYYLSLGYRVVAIEADPSLAGRLQSRFAQETAAGRLILLNVAVTEKDQDKIPFYISDDDSRSSLIKGASERGAVNIAVVEVGGRSLGSLFEEFGVPCYCKIDIEGYDATAIAGLVGYECRPPFISCESTCKAVEEVDRDKGLLYRTLDALVAAGYLKFKLVDQDSYRILSDADHYVFLHRFSTRVRMKMERWTGWYTPRYNRRLYELQQGSVRGDYSGVFGEALPGEWMDADTTKGYLARHFGDYFNHTKNKQLIFWVDIHATY
jgi:FkbM family methyltransferase